MTGFPINPPNAPLIDLRTGKVTPEWYKFFLAIQKLIGGPSDPFDDSALLSALPDKPLDLSGGAEAMLPPPSVPPPEPGDALAPGQRVFDVFEDRLEPYGAQRAAALETATLGSALTRTNDTNVTVTLGGSPTTALLAATSLTLGWTGELAVSRGGSGAATLTGLLLGNGTSAFTAIAPGTGVTTALAVNVGSAGAFVTFNGALGSPSSGTLTSCTGLPISTGVSGLGTGIATALAVNTGTVGAPAITGATATILGSTGADSATTLLVRGTARAVRIGTTAADALISGVDQTGAASYQPLVIAGLTLTFKSSATTVMTLGTTGIDVGGEVRCNTLRIDATPTAETPTPTHTVPVNINGTVYRFTCLV